MKFKNLDEILKLKIKKSLRKNGLNISICENSFVLINSELNIDALYSQLKSYILHHLI
jgi:hypothetical protein